MFSFFKKKKKQELEADELQPIPKIEYLKGTKFAANPENDLYLDFEELGGFPFVKVVIVGLLYTRIKNEGATLTFTFENKSLTLNSEHIEIESNEIKNTPISTTEIDFEVTKEEIETIKNTAIQQLSLNLKGEIIEFFIIPPEIKVEEEIVSEQIDSENQHTDSETENQ